MTGIVEKPLKLCNKIKSIVSNVKKIEKPMRRLTETDGRTGCCRCFVPPSSNCFGSTKSPCYSSASNAKLFVTELVSLPFRIMSYKLVTIRQL